MQDLKIILRLKTFIHSHILNHTNNSTHKHGLQDFVQQL